MRLRIAACAIVALWTCERAEAYPNGAPAGVTRAPGEGSCADTAVGCHAATLDDPAGQVTLSLADAATGSAPGPYSPGQRFTLVFSVTSGRTDRRAWGFEATALDMAGAFAGAFVATGDPTWQILSDPGFGRDYVTHAVRPIASSTGGSWTVAWTAPATDVGDVTFYVCGNAANGNGIQTGDFIRCSTFVVPAPARAPLLRIDATVTALAGGGAAACGPLTVPPEAGVLLTACDSPRTIGCVPAPAVPATRTVPYVVDPAGPDAVLGGEASPDAEAGILTFYEVEGCALVIVVSRRGSDLLVDSR